MANRADTCLDRASTNAALALDRSNPAESSIVMLHRDDVQVLMDAAAFVLHSRRTLRDINEFWK